MSGKEEELPAFESSTKMCHSPQRQAEEAARAESPNVKPGRPSKEKALKSDTAAGVETQLQYPFCVPKKKLSQITRPEQIDSEMNRVEV